MKSTTLIFQDSKLKAALLQRGEDTSTLGLRDLKPYYALLNYHLLELTLETVYKENIKGRESRH